MRIGLVSTLSAVVSDDTHGSIESVVWLLSRDLTARGHDVTVFGAAGSKPVGRLVAAVPGTYAVNGAPDDWQLCEWTNMCAATQRSEEFDVLHNHAYLWGLPLDALCRCPAVHTSHVSPYQ